MSDGIYAALSGAIAHQTSLESAATNLANSSTTGYRAIRPVFQEVLAKEGAEKDRIHFSSVTSTSVDTSSGGLKRTDRPLDIAMGQNTFLAVDTPTGERYTRAGSLMVAPDGALMTQNGHPVLNEVQTPLEGIPPNANVTITDAGEVKADGQSVGFLRLVTFDRPKDLTYEGAHLVSAENAGALNVSDEPITVGVLEQSNASPVRAVTDLMMATRMFDAMERAISTINTVDKRLVTSVPKGT